MIRRLHFFSFTFFTLLALTSSKESSSQSVVVGNEKTRVEVGINIGPSFFLGDLGGHRGVGTRFIKDLNLPLTEIMTGAFITFYPNEWLGVRAAAQYGKISGADATITTDGFAEMMRKQRNLDFRSNIEEAYVAAEVFPFMFLNKNNEEYKPRLRPYGVIGVGYLHFNPQGSLTDANGKKTWYYLRPLHTEGQGFAEYPKSKEYSLSQINIPMGLGFKYYISDRFNISLEILLRKSFTDYIDDVSTDYINPSIFSKYLSPENASIARRISDKLSSIIDPSLTRSAPGSMRGNRHQNDSYFTTFCKIGVRLGRAYNGGDSYDRSVVSRMRCPSRF